MTEQTTRPHRPVAVTVGELLQVEARIAALAVRGGDLRAELDAKAREVKERDGAAPTWRVRGMGTVSLSDPQARVQVTDSAAFGSWVAQRFPTEVTATIEIPGAGPEVLERALEALRENDVDLGPVRVTVRPSWQTTFLEGCAAVDKPPAEVFAPETGDQVDGVKLMPAAEGRISVRLDAQAKARAAAESESWSPPQVEGDDVADDAEGEPDYDAGEGRPPVVTGELAEALDLGPQRDVDAVPEVAAGTTEAEVFGLTVGQTLEDLTVMRLKDLCDRRHLKVSGTKPALIARLRENESATTGS